MKKNKDYAGEWSQLPTLIMWMIKDCLSSFLDHVHLASVCKNWKAACERYPFESRRQCVSPWLLQCHWKSVLTNSAIREFLNVSTNEKFILDLPELVKADILYSKQGWLLLRRKHQGTPLRTSIFMLNLHSREKILMPSPDICLLGSLASFSCSADGTPECVVFDVFNCSSMIYYTAFVGDENWTKHTYEIGRQTNFGNSGLVVDESKIYCNRGFTNLFIFDLVSLIWREIKEELDETYCGFWILSSEGRILKIQRGRNLNHFSFFKLNDSETGWEELINGDLEDRSWFLSIKRNNYFTAKGTGGLKILHDLTMEPSRRPVTYKIDTHNLTSGAITPYKLNKEAIWVDMGRIDKVPSSCVGYVPPSIL